MRFACGRARSGPTFAAVLMLRTTWCRERFSRIVIGKPWGDVVTPHTASSCFFNRCLTVFSPQVPIAIPHVHLLQLGKGRTDGRTEGQYCPSSCDWSTDRVAWFLLRQLTSETCRLVEGVAAVLKSTNANQTASWSPTSTAENLGSAATGGPEIPR
jgi:hypothetical protein